MAFFLLDDDGEEPPMDGTRLLVAAAATDARARLAAVLARGGFACDEAPDGEAILARVGEQAFDLVVLDLDLPPLGGVETLRRVKALRPRTLVVGATARGSVETVLAAFRAGAWDVLLEPAADAELVELVRRAVEIRRLGDSRSKLAEELETERLRVEALEHRLAEIDPFTRIVGGTGSLAKLLETIREVARTDSTVLLTGESGTGKGLVARTIHEASARAAGPFVEANCVVYSEGLLHSELFGHEKGAFTGAAKTKRGRFELARGGSLFLDEIGEIATSTQLLLLRVLQDRTFERVGGEETLEADVRLIAATNRNLEQAIREGTFRSDLYYRLNVIPLHLPPLREHPEDIPVLAQHFLEQCARRVGKDVSGFTPGAVEALLRHPWPGNVRELENVVERLVVLHRSGPIDLVDLPSGMRAEEAGGDLLAAPGTLQDLERQRIVQVLEEAAGNKKKAARLLGIHRSTLYAKMRRYGLAPAADDETAPAVPELAGTGA